MELPCSYYTIEKEIKIMDVLVGYTGFVGSNIAKKHCFDLLVNSKNVEMAYDSEPDLLVYAGVTGTKWLANKYPDEDLKIINDAFKNIKKISPKKLILISTVDIYDKLEFVDEDYMPDKTKLHTYGYNRYCLEQKVLNSYNNVRIVRLPALFGDNIRKNFIYDVIHLIPPILTVDVYEQLRKECEYISNKYSYDDVYRLFRICSLDRESNWKLREWFKKNEFNALNFTNIKSSYQFYDLRNLWDDIQKIQKLNGTIFNFVTEPLFVEEILNKLGYLTTSTSIDTKRINYNIFTKYSDLSGSYICTKDEVMKDLCEFIEQEIANMFTY